MKLSLKSILWCMCFLVTYWLFYTIYKIRYCSDYEEGEEAAAVVKYPSSVHLGEEYDHIYNLPTEKNTITYRFNRNLPIIFIVGIQGSGLDLMRQLLDENPYVRCGQDFLHKKNFKTRLIKVKSRFALEPPEAIFRHLSFFRNLHTIQRTPLLLNFFFVFIFFRESKLNDYLISQNDYLIL